MRSINLYLLGAILAYSGSGCETTSTAKKSKEASTLRLHLEVNPDGSPRNTTASVFRERPFLVTINREPFLTELDLESAEIVKADAFGGFAIRAQFSRHGTLLLENVTTVNRGRRIAIHSQFAESRWLAAPVIRQRITDGTMVFTPDATEEEAQRIVRGLNNLIAEVRKRSKF